jgi:hypothetical protein
MKPMVIIAISLVLLIPITAFAQSNSIEGLCPSGYTAEARGTDIVCVSNSDPFKTTQPNNAQPLDEQTTLIAGGVIVAIIIIAVIIKVASGGGDDEEDEDEKSYKNVKRRAFSAETKRIVKKKQKGKCAECGDYPTHWEFDHIDGRGDNSIENCDGLCRDCHQSKTLEDDW